MIRTTLALTLLLLTSALAGAEEHLGDAVCTVHYQNGELDLALITDSGGMASLHASIDSVAGFSLAALSTTSDDAVNVSAANLLPPHAVIGSGRR